MPIFVREGKIPIPYKMAITYNCEIGNGREKKCQNGISKLTLEEIATQLGTSKRDLQRMLRIESYFR